jgi:ribonuclease Z
MSARELFALGTSSQVPTRRRGHGGYFLRWDDEGFLFDPGDGTQRQLLLAGIPSTAIHHICITHFHGDHCLGLPGILQRLSLDRCEHPVVVHYPASGQIFFERLRHASIYHDAVTIVPAPIPEGDGPLLLASTERHRVSAMRLDHPVPTFGFRIEAPAGRRFVPERLEAAGVRGPRVGELARAGVLDVEGRKVRVEEVSEPRPPSAFAFVMDTRACEAATALARDADLVVMEATYAARDAELAAAYGHATAADAARTAVSAGAHRLAITHFSQRYHDAAEHLEEARALFPASMALEDLERVEIPRRR